MKKLVLVLGLVGISFISQSFKGSGNPESITFQKDSIKDSIRELIIKNYGQISEDPRLDPGLSGYIHKKITGESVEVKSHIADAYYSISFEGEGKISTILELLQGRFDKLKSSGYPITPDRYLINITKEKGKTYIAVALDETYIYPDNR